MSFYTSAISTQIIDAQFDSSKFRSEFRIVKDGLYSTAMRILNIGLLANEASAESGGRYNLLTGAHGVIRNIYLYDGRQVLDQVINYADKCAFNSYNHTNNENRDLYKALSKHGMGFVFDKQPVASSELPLPINHTLIKEDFPNQSHTPKESAQESALGFINLREVFPLLKQLPLVSTKMFPNLRVVVEYAVAESLVLNDAGAITGTALPILVVDQVMNDALEASTLSSFKNVVWTACEVESVTIAPVPSGTGVQSTKVRLNGFSNKTLMNMLVQKKGTTSVSSLYKSHGSITGYGEAIQVAVNGSNLFPLEGIISPNQRLALLHDTYGACDAHPGSANLAIYNSSDFIDFASARVGQTDYFGCVVGKPITSLELQYSREYDNSIDSRYKQGLTLNIFGSVLKSIVKTPKGYSVLYL
jgi:hypothetical protein